MATACTLYTTANKKEPSFRTILATAAIANVALEVSNGSPPSPLSMTGFVFKTADGKTTLTEPNVIASYLSEATADKAVTSQLLGATPEQRLTVQEWLSWNQARFQPVVKRLSTLIQDGQTYGPEQKIAVGELVEAVFHLEKELRDENWGGRDSLLGTGENVGSSLADIAVASTLHAAWAVGFDGEGRQDYGQSLRLYERVSQMEGLVDLFSEEEDCDS